MKLHLTIRAIFSLYLICFVNILDLDLKVSDGLGIIGTSFGSGLKIEEEDPSSKGFKQQSVPGKADCAEEGNAILPLPEIRVNSSELPILISASEDFTLTLGLDPGKCQLELSDWWIVSLSSAGQWQSLVFEEVFFWKAGLHRLAALPLNSLEQVEVPAPVLKTGKNFIVFALDKNADGRLDATWWDFAEVEVCSDYALLAKYAPTLIFSDSEAYFPTNVRDMTENSALCLVSATRENGGEGLVLNCAAPGQKKAEELQSNSSIGLAYWDLDQGYRQVWKPEKCVVYGRIVPDQENIYLQYWFFYIYNDWAESSQGLELKNSHEGDWEMITLELDKNRNPKRVGYSQHIRFEFAGLIYPGGELILWEDLNLEGESSPVVYVARGSHASYPDSGKTPIFFLGTDEHFGNLKLGPESPYYTLLEMNEDSNWKWMRADKLVWGEPGSDLAALGGSPKSPAGLGKKWRDPGAWLDSLGY